MKGHAPHSRRRRRGRAEPLQDRGGPDEEAGPRPPRRLNLSVVRRSSPSSRRSGSPTRLLLSDWWRARSAPPLTTTTMMTMELLTTRMEREGRSWRPPSPPTPTRQVVTSQVWSEPVSTSATCFSPELSPVSSASPPSRGHRQCGAAPAVSLSSTCPVFRNGPKTRPSSSRPSLMKTSVRSSTPGPVQSVELSTHPAPRPTGTCVTVGRCRILQLTPGWLLTPAAPSVRRNSNPPVDTPVCCSVTLVPVLRVQRWCQFPVCAAKLSPSPVAVATRPGPVSSSATSCYPAGSTPVHSPVTQSALPVPESVFRSVCVVERRRRDPVPALSGTVSRCAALSSPVGITPVRFCVMMAFVLHVPAPSAEPVPVARPSRLCRARRKCRRAVTRATAVCHVENTPVQ